MSIIKLTKDNFDREALQSAGPVLVEFWAPWCGYCRRAAPMVEELAGRTGFLPVGQVNVDEEPALEDRFGVELIPTLFVFRNGAPGGKLVAPSSVRQIEDFIAAELAK